MKTGRILGSIAAGAFAVVLACQAGGVASAAEGNDLIIHSSKVDITHGVGAEPIDQMDVVLTFSNTERSERGRCEKAADSPVTHGLTLTVQEGYCGAGGAGAQVTVPSFRPIPGTSSARYEGITIEGANVDALLRKLPTPAGSCGLWNLTLDAVPLNLSAVRSNPVAVSITVADGSTSCVNVTNALIDQ